MSEIQSDSDAIAASLADPGAFGVIFERHHDAVHGYLQRRLEGPFADELAPPENRRSPSPRLHRESAPRRSGANGLVESGFVGFLK